MLKTSCLRSLPLILGLALLNACGGAAQAPASTASTPIPPAKLYDATAIVTGWVPSLAVINGGATVTKDGGLTIQKITPIVQSAGMVRLNDPWGAKETVVSLGHFNASDFGPNGSISLQADVLDYPRAGGAYAVLTSFYVSKDGGGTQEYVNLAPACASSSGVWVCGGGNCNQNVSCGPQANSGFANRNDWEQHQFQGFGYGSTNSFPRCDASIAGWTCPSGQESLPAGNYYAKYLLMADSGSSVSSLSANLKVTPVIRKDPNARNTGSANGAINLNVVLVGSKNISDSHTAIGQQNLNLLFKETHTLLKANAGVGIQNIKVFEWNDVDGGDYYSQVPISNVGIMFSSGSQAVVAADDAKYINVFLVRDIPSGNSGYSILGVAGGILGAAVNGTQTSGLAFSTHVGYGSLLAYNPSCTLGGCLRKAQDSSFLELGETVAHELGHYLGLNHPSENAASASSQRHDALTDTPTCAPRTKANASTAMDQLSCYVDSNTQASPLAGTTCKAACDAAITATLGYAGVYTNAASTDPNPVPANLCPTVKECQFNHVMWYTTKNRIRTVTNEWTDDGSLISPQSSALVQWSSYVR